MAQKPSKKEFQQWAAGDLAKKLKLEVFLRTDMIRFFKKISSAQSILYASSGRNLMVIHYKDDLQKILSKHYRRVIKSFKDPMRSDERINQGLGIKKSQDDAELSEEDQQYIDNNSHSQAMIILTTTQKRIDETINNAKVDQHTEVSEAQTSAQAAQASGNSALTPAGETTAQQNNDAVAKNFSEKFDDDSENSADNIAATETQITAETAKMNAVTAAAGTAIMAVTIKKSWHGMLDSKERKWHLEAEGQTQNIGDPFAVNGELLMYPGDTSLGASADNICNCRCNSIYF